MRNYRIAFFTVDWNYALVEATLHGLKKYVNEHENVQLCVFDCFGKDTESAKDHSEYGIYNLADLSQFDGVLVQGNQIVLKSARDALGRRIARAGIPAVTIGSAVEGCALVNIDNERAQYDMTAHVIREHGAKKLVYLTGILDNGSLEARQRLDGFLAACRDNGVDEAEVEVFPCTWRTTDGNRVAEEWVRAGKPLPDAFICGNDEMALGVLETLTAHGYRVPRDTLITGFDNLDSAKLSSPRLSTVHRSYADMNYAAMDALIRRIDGVDTRDFIPFDYELVYSESCGCQNVARPNTIRDMYFHQTSFLKNFYILQDKIAEEMFEADNLKDLMGIVESNHEIFGCDSAYLCVNSFYWDEFDKKQWRRRSDTFDAEMVLSACGTNLPETADHLRFTRFPTSRLLPESLMARERFLIFYPLHYNTYSIGYLAMDSISDAAKLNLHKSIFSFLEIAIENVRKKCLLRQLNDELDDLYVRDGLTGLYNRFGYDRYAQQAFDACVKREGGARILFVDMDDLKPINDVFGHEIGDEAIRAAANALKTACGEDNFLMRYGGDEFLAIAPLKETGLEAAIQAAARAANEAHDLPYHLGLSVGTIEVPSDEPRSLDECVQAADALMYENKKRRKGLK